MKIAEVELVSERMMCFGGEFVYALGVALQSGTEDDAERIKTAFPEYWEKYKAWGKNERKEAEA